MSRIYAMRIKKADFALITMLNGGGAPAESMLKKKHWLLFMVDEDGKDCTTQIITESDLFETYDIAGHSPLVLRLKRY